MSIPPNKPPLAMFPVTGNTQLSQPQPTRLPNQTPAPPSTKAPNPGPSSTKAPNPGPSSTKAQNPGPSSTKAPNPAPIPNEEHTKLQNSSFSRLHSHLPFSLDPSLDALLANFAMGYKQHHDSGNLQALEAHIRQVSIELRARIKSFENMVLPGCKEPGCPNFTYFWMLGKLEELDGLYKITCQKMLDAGFVFGREQVMHGTARGSHCVVADGREGVGLGIKEGEGGEVAGGSRTVGGSDGAGGNGINGGDGKKAAVWGNGAEAANGMDGTNREADGNGTRVESTALGDDAIHGGNASVGVIGGKRAVGDGKM